ncbi:MAG: hypothetical protein K8R23_06835 [Chthoniobacter sp.]|nr:hypothetical protein [Chthoniobacter sp.]
MIPDIATGVGALLGTCLFPDIAQAAGAPVNRNADSPKRAIFFLQNQGFDPLMCIPKDLKESCALDGLTLEKPMQALELYKKQDAFHNGIA